MTNPYREALILADLKIRSFPGADQSDVEFIRAVLDRPANATPDDASTDQRLDWRKAAQLAGEHGIHYPSNAALVKFIVAIRHTRACDTRPADEAAAILEWVATRSDPAVATAWTCGLAATTLAWMLRLIRRNPQIVADTIQGTGHMWVEMDGKYYDPTIGQFGDFATSGDLPHPLSANPKAAIPIIHEVDAPRDTGNTEQVAWRCYHCDEVFTDDRCARLHFGRDETCAPACQIKAGAERGLIYALREAEYAAADAQLALATESTEAAKAYYALVARHATALRSAEEAGYERGLADGRAIANPAPQPSGDAA